MKIPEPLVQKTGGVVHVFSDGASRGNPGPAGAGAVLKDEAGSTLAEVSEYLGHLTNNQAEYKALIAALGRAVLLKPDRLVVHMDSELIVRQLDGRYRVSNPRMIPLYEEAVRLLRRFREVSIVHIQGEFNEEAHRLAGRAVARGIRSS